MDTSLEKSTYLAACAFGTRERVSSKYFFGAFFGDLFSDFVKLLNYNVRFETNNY